MVAYKALHLTTLSFTILISVLHTLATLKFFQLQEQVMPSLWSLKNTVFLSGPLILLFLPWPIRALPPGFSLHVLHLGSVPDTTRLDEVVLLCAFLNIVLLLSVRSITPYCNSLFIYVFFPPN